MTTKLKIDLKQGVLEVEGSETFVKNIYQEFKTQFFGENEEPPKKTSPRKSSRSKSSTSTRTTKKRTPNTKSASPASTNGAKTESPAAEPPPKPAEKSIIYHQVESLNLGRTKKHPSLVEFMENKLPITNEERNLVFIYYLQHTLKLENITPDHIYTCYREVNVRVPYSIESTLNSTPNHKKWVSITEDGQISVTTAGKQYVEEHLPKRVKI